MKTLEIIGKSILKALEFFGKLIGLVVLILLIFIFAINGTVFLDVDNYYDMASNHWFYEFTGDNLFFIHSIGVISIIIAMIITIYLISLIVKNLD